MKTKSKLLVAHPVVSKIKNEKISQSNGKPLRFDSEPAIVRVSLGTTLNMGNYQSLRIGVDLALPCREGDIEKAYTKAHKFVEKKLGEMIAENTQDNSSGSGEEDIV